MLERKRNEKLSRINISQLFVNANNNFTQTKLAESSGIYSHDAINRYFRKENFTGISLFQFTMQKMLINKHASIAFDDTVCEKRNTKSMELVYKQYSGLAGKPVNGIGVITASYNNHETNQSYGIYFNVYDPQSDGLKKTDHVYNQIKYFIEAKKLLFESILFDSYYSSAKILNFINNSGKFYYTKIKKNRIIYIKRNDQLEKYKLKDLKLTKEEIKYGVKVQLNNLHENHFVKLFCIGGTNACTEYIITNNIAQESPQLVQKEYKRRWNSETLYKDCKQLTGLGQCEGRKSIIHKNYIFFSIFTINCMRKIAYEIDMSDYKMKNKNYETL
jgi:SRSO17 transposase